MEWLPESWGELRYQPETRLGNMRLQPLAPDQTRSARPSDSQDRAEANPSRLAAEAPGELTCTPGQASCSGCLLAGRGRPREAPSAGERQHPAFRFPIPDCFFVRHRRQSGLHLGAPAPLSVEYNQNPPFPSSPSLASNARPYNSIPSAPSLWLPPTSPPILRAPPTPTPA